jgi:hypothetical protein
MACVVETADRPAVLGSYYSANVVMGIGSAQASGMREFERGLSACVALWGHDWLRWDLARASCKTQRI